MVVDTFLELLINTPFINTLEKLHQNFYLAPHVP